MPDRHGIALWPGVNGFISCTYTCSQGISPGIATLEIPEQDVSKIASFGDLTITDGFGGITLRRCRVAHIDFVREGGRRIVLHIADRRWQWRYGAITGSWNVIDPYPDPDLFPPGQFVAAGGPYAPGTFRPAHLLMADCLTAMNETNFLIAPAPSVPIPAEWDEEPPASALADLADTVGYRVCFKVGSDRVLIAPAGLGKSLPSELPIISESPSVGLPTRPATIQLVGGETLFHDYLRLEAVGFEPNGAIKHIDKLSYRPATGWTHCPPDTFSTVQATAQMNQREAIDLAKSCIWRTFRVKMVDVSTGRGPGPNVGGFGLVRDRKQIILRTQMYSQTKQANGQPDTSPPFVEGSIFIQQEDRRLQNGLDQVVGNCDALSGDRLPRTPSIDSGRGIVTFERQCFRFQSVAGKGHWTEPELYLSTGFNIRNIIGQIPVKFLRGGTVALNDLGCPPEVLRHPELVLIWQTLRNMTSDRTVKLTSSNIDDLIPPADYYLAQANAKYEITGATSRTYAGIFPIDLDGAVSQVTWRVGGGSPATTTASLNTEHDPYVPLFPERRKTEKLQALGGRSVAANLAELAPPPTAKHKRTTPEEKYPDPPPGA